MSAYREAVRRLSDLWIEYSLSTMSSGKPETRAHTIKSLATRPTMYKNPESSAVGTTLESIAGIVDTIYSDEDAFVDFVMLDDREETIRIETERLTEIHSWGMRPVFRKFDYKPMRTVTNQRQFLSVLTQTANSALHAEDMDLRRAINSFAKVMPSYRGLEATTLLFEVFTGKISKDLAKQFWEHGARFTEVLEGALAKFDVEVKNPYSYRSMVTRDYTKWRAFTVQMLDRLRAELVYDMIASGKYVTPEALRLF